MKPVTVDEYKEYGNEFFDKYFYVSKELGEGSKAEDVLKVMEVLSALVITKRKDDKSPLGFNKKTEEVD